MRKLIFVQIMLIYFISFSQNSKKIDSINQIIVKTKSDSIKSVEYLTISNLHIQKDSIFNNITKSLLYARKAKSPKRISNARVNLANWYQINISRKRAIKEHLDAIGELETFNFKSGIANHYIRLGYRYNITHQDSMLFYLDKGVELAKESNDASVMVIGLLALGNISFFNEDFNKALGYYIEVEKICNTTTSLINTEKHANSLEYIGYVMQKIKRFDKAIEYFYKSYDIVIKLGFPSNIAVMESNIAQQYMIEEKYSNAIPLLNKSIAYYETFKVPDNRSISAYIDRGLCYKHLNKFKESEYDFLKAVEISKLPKNKKHYTNALYRLADAYLYFKDYKNAEQYYREAEILCKQEKNYDYLRIIYKGLAEIETYNKNYEEAISLLNETIKNTELERETKLSEAILKVETEFQTQKKEKEIELLKLKNEIEKKQKYYYLAFLALILAVSILIFLVFRNKIKIASKEKELNKIKSHFLSNISHEFRTPLTLINGPLIKLLESETLNDETKPSLQLIQKNTNRLIELVDQILELSKLDAGVVKISVEKGDLESFIRSSTDAFQFLAKEKKLKLHTSIDKMPWAWFDTDILDKIMNNLFSNALKYTAPFGKITFEGFVKDNKELILSITNEVKNFQEKDLNKLFERFYKSEEQSEGTGIGLSMIKELVNLMHGKIEAQIIDAKKINFKITLPIAENAFSSNEKKVVESENNIDLVKKQTKEKPIILIVDDNKNIRDYLGSLLTESYNILESVDGDEGIKMAINHLPDVIISDVMMPNINGIELCNNLKNNELTSHIPIILLTAKSGDFNEISGLQSGADDYITKPFNPKTLQIKINNIVESRKALQERYKKDVIFKPKDIAITSSDEVFLNKIKKVLDKHLNSPDFNPELFSNEMELSRMQLHRKLMAFTGLNTSAFIRSQRLIQAIQILKTSNHTVNEVAYMVGFNTPSYFMKCFKEVYGKTPSEYIN